MSNTDPIKKKLTVAQVLMKCKQFVTTPVLFYQTFGIITLITVSYHLSLTISNIVVTCRAAEFEHFDFGYALF